MTNPLNQGEDGPVLIELAERLTEAAQQALLGAHRLSDYTTERAIYHRCPQEVLDELWDAGLIAGARYVNRLGMEARSILAARAITQNGGQS